MMPHRYPFLLIDRLTDIKNDEYAVGLKNVTINEPFFSCHFPGKKVMPGVLIVESMAQITRAAAAQQQRRQRVNSIRVFFSTQTLILSNLRLIIINNCIRKQCQKLSTLNIIFQPHIFNKFLYEFVAWS